MCRGVGTHHHVQEVGGAAHHAAHGIHPGLHHVAPAAQVLGGARLNEGQTHARAGRRRQERHLVRQGGIALHVVKIRDGLNRAPETAVDRHVLDALAINPDGTVILEGGDVIGPAAHAVSCPGHGFRFDLHIAIHS